MWSNAKAVEEVDAVLVATDDERIAQHVASFGGEFVMTPTECKNGTERVYAALNEKGITPDIIINLQGDTPIIPHWIPQAVVDYLKSHPESQLATPAVKLTTEQVKKYLANSRAGIIGGTFVTFDKNHRALYFSKTVIPNPQEKKLDTTDVYKHLGIYGYRYESLKEYLSYPEARLERAETLEQLRALENGMKIDVVEVDFKGRTTWSVDNPEDVAEVEKIIASEGELLP